MSTCGSFPFIHSFYFHSSLRLVQQFFTSSLRSLVPYVYIFSLSVMALFEAHFCVDEQWYNQINAKRYFLLLRVCLTLFNVLCVYTCVYVSRHAFGGYFSLSVLLPLFFIHSHFFSSSLVHHTSHSFHALSEGDARLFSIAFLVALYIMSLNRIQKIVKTMRMRRVE